MSSQLASPPTASTQPAGSSSTPSTCAAVESNCSKDLDCKQLLTRFNWRCLRAMHHGHRKHCHQRLCIKQLKRACQLRHGKRGCTNSNCHRLDFFAKPCREAIAACLLDSCCWKAYMEFLDLVQNPVALCVQVNELAKFDPELSAKMF